MTHLERCFKVSGVDEMRDLYDDWAKTYNQDMAEGSQDYVAPAITCEVVRKTLSKPSIDASLEILDAGCGTGLVGVNLAKLGAKLIDGIDLSPGMLAIARETGAYRDLNTADLTKTLDIKDDSYDVVVCVGTLTQGHVGPEALGELVRVVKKGGYIVATVRDSIWKEGGYEAKMNSLVSEGKAKVVTETMEEYRRGAGVEARMIVLQAL